MIVNATNLETEAILAFEASVIGKKAKERTSIVGYPIIASHQFGSTVFDHDIVQAEREGAGAVGRIRNADAVVPPQVRGRDGERLKLPQSG